MKNRMFVGLAVLVLCATNLQAGTKVVCQGPTGANEPQQCNCGEPGQPPCSCNSYNDVFDFIQTSTLAPNYFEHTSGGHTYGAVSSNGCVYNPGIGFCTANGYVDWYTNTITESGNLITSITGHSTAKNQQNVYYSGTPGQPLYISAYAAGAVASSVGNDCSGGCTPIISFAPPMGQSGGQPQYILGPEDNHWAWKPSVENQMYCPEEYVAGTPAVVILDGKGWDDAFTSLKDGIDFDLINTGYKVQTAWTNPDREVAFLVLNRDAYQRPLPPTAPFVLNARTVFGSYTNQRPPYVQGGPILAAGEAYRPNAFYALKTLTLPISPLSGQDVTNGGLGRNKFGEGDGLYDKGWVGLWVDTAHDGIFEHGTFRTLKQAGLKYIYLDFTTWHNSLHR